MSGHLIPAPGWEAVCVAGPTDDAGAGRPAYVRYPVLGWELRTKEVPTRDAAGVGVLRWEEAVSGWFVTPLEIVRDDKCLRFVCFVRTGESMNQEQMNLAHEISTVLYPKSP